MQQQQDTRVVAIDLSLTGTGLAFPGLDGAVVTTTVGEKNTSPTIEQYLDRVDRLAHKIIDASQICSGDRVVVEGLSLHSKSSSLDRIFASWWLVVKELIATTGSAPVVVTPQQRAQYATGKGSSSKDTVMLATAKRYPGVDIRNNNEADALVLYAMARRQLGRPLEDSLPLTHLKVLANVAWWGTD
jgi:hypothetical protein